MQEASNASVCRSKVQILSGKPWVDPTPSRRIDGLQLRREFRYNAKSLVALAKIPATGLITRHPWGTSITEVTPTEPPAHRVGENLRCVLCVDAADGYH